MTDKKPDLVASRVTSSDASASVAGAVLRHLCTEFRSLHPVEPLDPASLAQTTALEGEAAHLQDLVEAAIKDEYGKDLRELSQDEAWPLLDALSRATTALASRSSRLDQSDVERILEELRGQR